jgi:hypothetical protein
MIERVIIKFSIIFTFDILNCLTSLLKRKNLLP